MQRYSAQLKRQTLGIETVRNEDRDKHRAVNGERDAGDECRLRFAASASLSFPLADFTRMHDSSTMFAAAVDPAGPFAAVCGITWTLLCPTSCVAAVVSAALCPFQRMTRQALRLSRVGLWAGSIAFVVATVATVRTPPRVGCRCRDLGVAHGCCPSACLFRWSL